MTTQDWDQQDAAPKQALTVEQMDQLVVDLKAKEIQYEEAKTLSDALYAEYTQAKARIIEALESTNRDVFISSTGVRVTLSHAMSVQTPKTTDEKVAFFKWLRENKGDEVADAYMTVNSNSLNSLYNTLTEEWAQRGEVLTIPGLGEPVSRKKLSVRG
jgi:2,3-bisphosphoglycerate-independent phosphoglycerate mutase